MWLYVVYVCACLMYLSVGCLVVFDCFIYIVNLPNPAGGFSVKNISFVMKKQKKLLQIANIVDNKKLSFK